VITQSYIGRRPPISLIIGSITAAGLLLRFYQLSKPGYLLGVTQYDDGVLFGNVVRLLQGVIPYRDFVMVQPPGSMLIMAPVALLAKATGTAWGLAVARLLTACADAACIVLLGLLVRHRGALAVTVACGSYAIYPGALMASETFLLEPWLNLFCLVAALLIFDKDRFADGWRLALGGSALGFAVAVKLWAAVPLLVAGLLLVSKPRQLGRLAAGAFAGLAIPVLPFLALAHGQFVSQVITSQYLRSAQPHPLLPRLTDMAGLSMLRGLPSAAGLVLLLAITAYLVAGYLVTSVAARRLPPALDCYALSALAAVIVMFLLPSEYYSHYAAFAAPFGALAFALPAGTRRQRQPRSVRTGRLAALPVSGLVVAAVIATAGFRQVASEPTGPPAPVAAVERMVPAGSCVITNDPALTIAADRFIAVRHDCPTVVDTYGTLLAMTGGRPQSAAVQTMQTAELTWQQWFHQANYVWLDTADHGLPWANSLYNYLGVHFRRVPVPGGAPVTPQEPPDTRGGLFHRIRWCPVTFHRTGCPSAIRRRVSRPRAGGARQSPKYQ
jgi:alpha-1,2-mannosyltransferase